MVRILKTKLPPDPGDPSQYADLPTPLILGVYAEQVHRVTPQATPQSALYQPHSEEAIRAIKDMHLHSANLAIRLPTPPPTFPPTQWPVVNINAPVSAVAAGDILHLRMHCCMMHAMFRMLLLHLGQALVHLLPPCMHICGVAQMFF